MRRPLPLALSLVGLAACVGYVLVRQDARAARVERGAAAPAAAAVSAPPAAVAASARLAATAPTAKPASAPVEQAPAAASASVFAPARAGDTPYQRDLRVTLADAFRTFVTRAEVTPEQEARVIVILSDVQEELHTAGADIDELERGDISLPAGKHTKAEAEWAAQRIRNARGKEADAYGDAVREAQADELERRLAEVLTPAQLRAFEDTAIDAWKLQAVDLFAAKP